MIYLYLFGTCFHFIYVFMIIGNELQMGLGLPWTANRFALFNFNTTPQGNNGYADFNWFRFTNK